MRTRGSVLSVAILLAALALSVDAQQPPPVSGRGGGRGVQRPQRDSREPVPAGTGVIAGRVVAADSGRPIKRARIVVTGGGRPFSASTDQAGRFRITGLPVASYNVMATKSGFVDATFGQRRPRRAGMPVELAEGQEVLNADIRMHRGGVITGRVVDEDGEPLAQAIVTVLRYQYVRGERQMTPAGVDQSDDRGQFRIFGLAPGDYFVSAAPGGLERLVLGGAVTVEEPAESTGYAPTYYPGVIASNDAARLKLASAQELGGVDFQLQLVPLATVSGIVAGGPALITLSPEGAPVGGGGRGGRGGLGGGLGNVMAGPMRGGQVMRAGSAADGTFAIRNVPPGKYTIIARSSDAQGAGLTAIQPLLVAAEQVTVALAPVPAVTMKGTITLESSGTALPRGFSGFRIAATALGAIAALPRGTRPADPDPQGDFTIEDVIPGNYMVAGTAPRGWTLKAVYLDGREVTDRPIEVRAGDLTGLNVIFSDRVSSVTGTVRDGRGNGAAGLTVIAFTTDDSLWFPQSRHIVTSRTDASGAYRLSALPAGDYRILAVEDVEPGEWFDPEYLEQVKESAQRITLGEGEQRQQDLKPSGA